MTQILPARVRDSNSVPLNGKCNVKAASSPVKTVVGFRDSSFTPNKKQNNMIPVYSWLIISQIWAAAGEPALFGISLAVALIMYLMERFDKK